MTKRDAIDYLHEKMGYSRRMSAKLTELAMLSKSNKSIGFALQTAIEDNVGTVEKARKRFRKQKKQEPKRFIARPAQHDQGIGKVGTSLQGD
jgi:hypothetical protein